MIAHVLALALVTATVTLPGAGTWGAQAQAPASYAVVITNLNTGYKMYYKRQQWPDQNGCDNAIRGIDASLKSVAAMRFGPNGEVVGALVPAPNANEELAFSIDRLLSAVLENTGKFPNFGITCELQADPA
jgi:hypothetical protein